jgi:CheY-like chemotaxis protein
MQGKTVLVADDDEIFLDMLSEILKDEGARVCVARNGEEGVSLALSEHPDIAVFDMMMPRMTGMEAIQKIREDTWGNTLPVVLLTNMGGQEVPPFPQGAKAECLLKTDWTLEKLAQHLKEMLG